MSSTTDSFFKERLTAEQASDASCPPVWCWQPVLPLPPYLLPPSGSWPPTLDWALLSWLDTSLSSAPRKRSRKASGLWFWGCKCLAAHTRSDMIRRHNLKGHRCEALAQRRERKALFSFWALGSGSTSLCWGPHSFLWKQCCPHYGFVLPTPQLYKGMSLQMGTSKLSCSPFLLLLWSSLSRLVSTRVIKNTIYK